MIDFECEQRRIVLLVFGSFAGAIFEYALPSHVAAPILIGEELTQNLIVG